MKFDDVLRRYNVSPLCYEDGTRLAEKDYVKLFSMWMNYRFVTRRECTFSPDRERMARLVNWEKKMLFPMEDGDKMDIMMRISPLVISGDENKAEEKQ